MKKILVGTTLAVFAVAPTLAAADCGGDHDKASMASSQPAQKSAQAPAASNTSSPAVAKATAASKVKQAVVKPTAPKASATTVVAKSN